jgi:hypothetical protein
MKDIFAVTRPLRRCGAMADSGKPCRRWAVEGEYFCALHLSQGYGLFTKALKMIRRKSVDVKTQGMKSSVPPARAS